MTSNSGSPTASSISNAFGFGSLQNSFNQITQTPLSGSEVYGPPNPLGQSGAAGGVPALSNLVGQAGIGTSSSNATSDTRVRLGFLDSTLYGGASGGASPASVPIPGSSSSSPGSSILSILAGTNGMLFPYSPSITLNQSVDYMDLALVHSNTNYQAYTRTPSVKISINGKFTVQNQQEGIYALAAVHFLRVASKSHFGESDPQAGRPPPVLLFSGYGCYMFGQSGPTGGLRTILNSHSWAYDENIDTIAINAGSGIVRLPSMFTIQVELTVIQTPARMRNVFNFQKFASGELMKNSDGWI